ncbi:transglutaminase domain-containing protein [Gryllotalpicola ginsengisoli]|uniref:transglutaminase domain-containing protein n=1 Tax=Gryllotalpicola ginsengisoli TaxID=444608 RepID=UPI0003B6B2C1|nr:transglutaminase domain-containing protein [Gryllotalpicola ginsengisoli]
MSRHGARSYDPAAAVDAAFIVALAAVAVFAAWPIYETPYLLLTAAGALALAYGVTALGRMLRWSWLATTFAALLCYAAFGVPLAIPQSFASRLDLALGYRQLASATVFGFKRLVTVPLPVGHYQELLVPFYLVLFVCALVAFTLVLRGRRGQGAVVPVMLVPIAFGPAFGSSRMSDAISVFGFRVLAPLQLLLAVLALGLCGGFLVWRAQHARRVSLRTAESASGVHRASGGGWATLRRAAAAAGVSLVAVIVAVPIASTALAPGDRQVLRTSIDPTVQLRRYESPLTTYRTAFTPSQFDTPLLTVKGDLAKVGRLRVATLSYYNGQQFQVLSQTGDVATAFKRIPQLTAGGAGDDAEVTVTIDDWDEAWLPTVSGLSSVSFAGSRANSLTDGFYYNTDADAGVQLNPLHRGDSYTLAASTSGSAQSQTLADLPAPAPATQTSDIPKSLTEWVRQQGVSADGAGLEKLIDRLRARGYLSHSLDKPASDVPDADSWVAQLRQAAPGYKWQASPAGESMDRIGDMFTDLLRAQQQTDSTDDADLVAAVGDDEQFAVASALIAESLGYDARVVLGFDLTASATGGANDGVKACADGVCRGQNLSAWVEVKGADDTWIAVDTTPQFTQPLSPDQTKQRYPWKGTEVDQKGAQVQNPPEANPSGDDRRPEQSNTETSHDSQLLVPVLRIGGTIVLVLMVLAAPFASVLIVKAARRRERRRAASAAERMAAGWDELVDAAVDLGLPAPGVRTRAEAATLYASVVRSADPRALRTLAADADEAVFGAFDPPAQAAEGYWATLDEQLERLAAGFPTWKRLFARFSLRSFRTGRGRG